MAVNLVDLAETIEKLTAEEKKALNILMGNESNDDTSVDTLLRSLRFKKNRVCPFCGGTHVVKNGKRNDGTQKYYCKECGRNPLATSNSILCGTHKDLATWLKFIECELDDEPLNRIAEKCIFRGSTAFIHHL